MFTQAVNAINSLNKSELLDLSSIIDNRLKYLEAKGKSYYAFITNIAPFLNKDYFERTLPGKVIAMEQKEWVLMAFSDKYNFDYSMRNYGWKVDGHRLRIIRLNKHVFKSIIKKSRKVNVLDMSLDELYDKGYCPEIIESDNYIGDSLPYPKVSSKQLDIELYTFLYDWRKSYDPNY